MSAAQIILGLVLVQRLAELALARRNSARLLAQGGVEHGAEHYPYLVLMHAGWLASLVFFVPENAAVNWAWLALYGVLQIGRFWVIASLGPFWTTRVITLPDASLVRRGPYRYMRHPNYAIVAAEIAVLPLVFGLWWIALVFSALNALVIRERIAVEERALAQRRGLSPSEN
jgi:methyltransferase